MSDVKQRVISIVMGREHIPSQTIELQKDEVVVKRTEADELAVQFANQMIENLRTNVPINQARQAALAEFSAHDQEISIDDKKSVHSIYCDHADCNGDKCVGPAYERTADFAQGGDVPAGPVYTVGEFRSMPEPHHEALYVQMFGRGNRVDSKETFIPASECSGTININKHLGPIPPMDPELIAALKQHGKPPACLVAAPDPSNDATGVSVEPVEPSGNTETNKKPYIRFGMVDDTNQIFPRMGWPTALVPDVLPSVVL